jgi:IS30 family transposase
MEMRERKAKQQNFEAANAERRRQIVQDSARLLRVAASLKAEVDATAKDTVSPSVMVKAGEIERLAHIVKEKMKLTVGAG